MTKLKTRDLITEPANEGTSGFSFETDPIQHAYEINFSSQLGKALVEHGETNLVVMDFGCGNGAKTLGLMEIVRNAGYTGSITYDGLDIDESGLENADARFSQQLGLIDEHALHQISMLDLTGLKNLLEQTKGREGTHVLLFQDSLHWLQPTEIQAVLDVVFEYSPPGTYVLASCCSVWNTTSIGAEDCPRQEENIKRVQELLASDPLKPVGRTADQLEYSTDMTHFTPTSMAHVFEKAGFDVVDCSWCNNLGFPNGRENLSENVDLIAIKRE